MWSNAAWALVIVLGGADRSAGAGARATSEAAGPGTASWLATDPPAAEVPRTAAEDGDQTHTASPEDGTEAGRGRRWIFFDLGARYLYGPISGSLQTPAGGRPGSSTPGRPSLEELGHDVVHAADVALEGRVCGWRLGAGARIIRLSGDAVIQTDLTSQNAFYPAGTAVRSDILLDWYRVGAGYELGFDVKGEAAGTGTRGRWHRLALTPGLEGAILDFAYRLNGAAGQVTDRAYRQPGLRIGGTAAWETPWPLEIEGAAWWGVPITSTAEILSLELVAVYRLWGERGDRAVAAVLGVGYDEIRFQDSQTMPNDVGVDMGPVLMAGLRVRF